MTGIKIEYLPDRQQKSHPNFPDDFLGFSVWPVLHLTPLTIYYYS